MSCEHRDVDVSVRTRIEVVRCDRCRTELAPPVESIAGRVRALPPDTAGWLHLARMGLDGLLLHEDALHFCPTCAAAALAGARGR